jgi:fumarate hydratase class II
MTNNQWRSSWIHKHQNVQTVGEVVSDMPIGGVDVGSVLTHKPSMYVNTASVIQKNTRMTVRDGEAQILTRFLVMLNAIGAVAATRNGLKPGDFG